MDAARVESRPDRREEYVEGETGPGGEKGAIGETSNGRAPSWDWPKAGADDCRPNGGGSRFRTPVACWTPLPDILHSSGRRTWTLAASQTSEWALCVVPGWAPNGDVADELVQATKQSRVAHPHPVAYSTKRISHESSSRQGRESGKDGSGDEAW